MYQFAEHYSETARLLDEQAKGDEWGSSAPRLLIVRSDPVLSHLDVINPEALKVTDFDRSLVAAKNTFAKRRYLFEPQPKDEWFCAHLLREAIRAVTSMDVRLAGLSKPRE